MLGYALALRFGEHDVDALLEMMTAEQIKGWAAFFRVKGDVEEGHLLEAQAQFNITRR